MREYRSDYTFFTFKDVNVETYVDVDKIRKFFHDNGFTNISVDETDCRVVILEKEGINALVITGK